MAGLSIAGGVDRASWTRLTDGLVVATAVSLPWSTSATSILAVLWLLTLIPTLQWAQVRRELATPAGGLPVLLLLLGLAGMAWADVSLAERLKGFDSFLKLLAVPLLFAQFRRSERGRWVLGGYFLSCTVLLVLSYVGYGVAPLAALLAKGDHVLVKNGPTQSGEFVTCIFGALFLAAGYFERRCWYWLAGTLVVAFGMLMNILFVTTGRTALFLIPVLLVLFAMRLSAKGIAAVLTATLVLTAIAWTSSPLLRKRMEAVLTNFQHYEKTDERNSIGERVEFAKKSLDFVREAPIIGHGTGSIGALFRQSAVGQAGAAGVTTTNPHNQTFAVAIQLGLVGALVLWAMWISHLLMFRGGGLAAWVGLMLVVQNIVGSLFNSHLFDFVQGWVYVLGVGVAGGMMLKARAAKGSAGPPP